ncbi:hypothetical protein BDQ94DRAFT_132460 [Aspergillus welwitschiae]|uniref:Uncharacterized protein n=1 Tax=Aspergillus welwitschiae TaxID=1341132 RepID=A0A3F3QKC9_9EURO|nr:hypothetical protein BDQ94DRAFT_132460 [Aspergillus welwitschiae]RDH39136.1 hypothetical protein BDQ94DRAFT_132460 [Aspergillus welwitschiae]
MEKQTYYSPLHSYIPKKETEKSLTHLCSYSVLDNLSRTVILSLTPNKYTNLSKHTATSIHPSSPLNRTVPIQPVRLSGTKAKTKAKSNLLYVT